MLTVSLTGAAVAVGGLGAATAVLTRATRTAGVVLRSALTAAIGAAGVLILVAIGIRQGRLDAFGAMHAMYLLVTIGLPVTGLGLLARSARADRALSLRVLGVALLAPGAVGLYATHIEPFRLEIDEVTVPVDASRAGDDPIRIAVLADLQTASVGDHERRAISEVLAADADLIVLPGDLFGGSAAEFDRELPALQAELQRLEAPHGVYFVEGDAEHGDRAARALAGSQVRILDGEVVEIEVGDRRLLLGGHALHYTTAAADRTRDQLVDAGGTDAITILVSHRPDTVLHLPSASALDLTIAGHTHGGQVVVPGFGPLITLSQVPRDVARGGLHELDGNRLYVSTGVGMERGQAPQVRLFSRPSIAVLTLTG